jgi:hypothetical protein
VAPIEDHMQRVRILRWLAAVIALVISIFALYTVFIHPISKAELFVTAFEDGEFKPYHFDTFSTQLSVLPSHPVIKSVRARVLPRSLNDLCHFQARVELIVRWLDKDNAKFDVTDEAEIAIAIGGIQRTLRSRTQAK